jgi:hypothetical protein
MAGQAVQLFLQGILAVCSVTVMAVTAFAEKTDILFNPVPEDFAYGADLMLTSDLPLQSVFLPADLYREQTSNSGDDFRVYNAAGVAVAISRSVVDEVNRQEISSALSLFPVQVDAPDDLSNLRLLVDQNEASTTIQLMQNQDGVGETGDRIKYYIVALPEEWFKEGAPVLTALVFDWQLPEFGFIEGISIETSGDLKSWRRWITGESLSRLQWQNTEVGQSGIDVPGIKSGQIQRYLRINWQGDGVVDITSVKAVLQNQLQLDQQQWLAINDNWQVDVSDDSLINQMSITFENGGKLPLSGLSLQPKQGNGFVEGQLYSRTDEQNRWIQRTRFTQYAIEISESQKVISKPVEFAVSRDEFWKIEFNSQVSQAQLNDWDINIAWTPQRISFIREGHEPFLLAWGNPYIKTTNSDLSYLYDLLTDEQKQQFLEQPAEVGNKRELGGIAKLALKSEVPWVLILLWAALLLGVAMMAWMAVSLSKQMRKES